MFSKVNKNPTKGNSQFQVNKLSSFTKENSQESSSICSFDFPCRYNLDLAGKRLESKAGFHAKNFPF